MNEYGELTDEDIERILKERKKKLPDVPYRCKCGHEGLMKEVIENNWKCPSCGWAQWTVKGVE